MLKIVKTVKTFKPSALAKKAALGITIALGTVGVASADIAADINTAVSSGTANVTLVAAGLIGMAAVMMGVGLIVRAMGR